MKQRLLKLMMLVALIGFSAGQAQGGNITTGTVSGGSLTFHKDAACATAAITSANGGTVYIKAVPDGTHSLRNATQSVSITIEKVGKTGVAEARRHTSIGVTLTVTTVDATNGIYSFTMPDDGADAIVSATFPDKRQVTITAGSLSRAFDGQPLTVSTFSVAGQVEGDTHQFAVTMTAESTITAVGSQPNVIASVDGVPVTTGTETAVGDYLVTTVDGMLTIYKGTISGVTVTPFSGTYDGKPHGISVTAPEGATVTYGTTEDDCTAAESPTFVNVGMHTVYYKVTLDSHEDMTSSVPVAIAKAPLTITAKPRAITYGEAPTNNGVTYSGFVNDETKDVLGGKLTYKYSYDQYGDVGSYKITPKGLTAQNYLITNVAGKLTVDKRSVGLKWSQASYTYDGESHAPTATATNLVNGDNISVTVSGEGTDVGDYTATATGLTGGKAGNYSLPSNSTFTFSIVPKTIENEDITVVTEDQDGCHATIHEGTGHAEVVVNEVTTVSLDYERKLSAPSGSGDATVEGQAVSLFTLCLPFVPQASGLKFYTLSSVDGSTLTFDEVGTPAANTPYLVSVTSNTEISRNIASFNFKSAVSGGKTVDGYALKGTFTGLTNAEAAGKYILQNGGIWGQVPAGNASVYIPPFRAYIEGTGSDARQLDSSFSENATAINALRLLDSDGTERWYDLQGRRIKQPTKKGIYVFKGKKVKR